MLNRKKFKKEKGRKTMNIVAICGIVLVVAVMSVMLKKYVPEYSVIITIAAGAVILIAMLSQFLPAVYQIKNLLVSSEIPGEYSLILFKALGICFVAQFASDSCKDAGEVSLSSKVELAGKLAIVITALPLFEKVTQTALNLMGG